MQRRWYDQVCIDQDNHDKKMFEIKRTHLIYANAFSTLALVPELYRMNDSSDPGKALNSLEILRSQWCTRIWTLEEAYMSRNILFVGRDAYLWCDDNDVSQYHGTTALFIKNIQHGYKKQKWKACTALWYARTRTSSKAHDRIFALLNIFPELKDKVPFNYQQPVLDLMISFYGLLAKEDPSILAFGLPSKYLLVEFEKFTITQKETSMLPSWTGANGVHVPQACFKYETSTESYCCNVTGECISLTSEFIFAHVGIAETVECDEPYFERRRQGKYGCAKDGIPFQFLARRFGITAPKTNHLTFATTTPKSQEIHSDHTLHCGLYATHFLPLIEENWAAVNTLSNPTCIGGVLSLTENTPECIILTGLEFKISTTSYNSVEDGYYRCYPVITKYKDHYKSIGLCFFDRDRGFYSTVIQPRQTFCIR